MNVALNIFCCFLSSLPVHSQQSTDARLQQRAECRSLKSELEGHLPERVEAVVTGALEWYEVSFARCPTRQELAGHVVYQCGQ